MTGPLQWIVLASGRESRPLMNRLPMNSLPSAGGCRALPPHVVRNITIRRPVRSNASVGPGPPVFPR